MSFDHSKVHAILGQIRDAVESLEEWNKEIHSPDDFYSSPDGMRTLAADCMMIEAIGEGFRRIDKITDGKLLVKRPEIPWADVIGIRNHIAHGYFDIDGEIIFQTLKSDLGTLKEAIDGLLEITK